MDLLSEFAEFLKGFSLVFYKIYLSHLLVHVYGGIFTMAYFQWSLHTCSSGVSILPGKQQEQWALDNCCTHLLNQSRVNPIFVNTSQVRIFPYGECVSGDLTNVCGKMLPRISPEFGEL